MESGEDWVEVTDVLVNQPDIIICDYKDVLLDRSMDPPNECTF